MYITFNFKLGIKWGLGKDRSCKETAKKDTKGNIIILTEWSIDYESHNYIIEDHVRKKIINNDYDINDLKKKSYQIQFF